MRAAPKVGLKISLMIFVVRLWISVIRVSDFNKPLLGQYALVQMADRSSSAARCNCCSSILGRVVATYRAVPYIRESFGCEYSGPQT